MAIKKKKPSKQLDETDSAYFLKLVMYLILGVQWFRILPENGTQIPIPVGLFIGLAFASHDHFKIDRKIEFAVLLVATLVAFWLPIGIELRV